MRCHICDRVLDEPKFNADLEGYEPCDPCLLIIMETVGTFDDRPYVNDDELPEEGTFRWPVDSSAWDVYEDDLPIP